MLFLAKRADQILTMMSDAIGFDKIMKKKNHEFLQNFRQILSLSQHYRGISIDLKKLFGKIGFEFYEREV